MDAVPDPRQSSSAATSVYDSDPTPARQNRTTCPETILPGGCTGQSITHCPLTTWALFEGLARMLPR
jgi:hypothetical protein